MFAEDIRDSLLGILGEIGGLGINEIQLEHPADLKNGDYSLNIALVLAKKEKKNPKELAEEIKTKWQEADLPECVEKIEVAGPGFLNIWLSFDAYSKQITAVLKDGENYGRGLKPAKTERKTMVIDYSAPNIAKPFGIGHLRSTNIGQAVYNLYQFLGWKVIGDNHLGDWGTQFGKLICQIEIKNQKSKIKNKELTIGDLERLYVEFHKEAETHPEMEEEAREWFKKLEEGDKEATEIWQACIDISNKEFDKVYELLGVHIDYAFGESFYLDKMGAVLEDCKKKGILKESEGAKVVEIPGMELPAMLVKSNGATTYFLRDLAAIKYRFEKWQPNLIIYEVGADQTLHFAQLFNVATQLGYGQLNNFVHVAHGLIRWKEGKFSTRKGMTIHLEEVLNEAIKRATAFVPPSGTSASQRKKIAQVVGIGAIKYNDLKQNPRTDIIFDWDQILTLQGNSGPYLQYAYARTQSVLAKSKIRSTKFETMNVVIPTNPERSRRGVEESLSPVTGKRSLDCARDDVSDEEIMLLRTLYRFPEIVAEAAKTYSPNLICNFLFDLAQKFNLFYDKQRIIGSDNEQFRLLLTEATGRVLKSGLEILGIETLQKM